jgi:hypothetical protein
VFTHHRSVNILATPRYRFDSFPYRQHQFGDKHKSLRSESCGLHVRNRGRTRCPWGSETCPLRGWDPSNLEIYSPSALEVFSQRLPPPCSPLLRSNTPTTTYSIGASPRLLVMKARSRRFQYSPTSDVFRQCICCRMPSCYQRIEPEHY